VSHLAVADVKNREPPGQHTSSYMVFFIPRAGRPDPATLAPNVPISAAPRHILQKPCYLTAFNRLAPRTMPPCSPATCSSTSVNHLAMWQRCARSAYTDRVCRLSDGCDRVDSTTPLRELQLRPDPTGIQRV